MTTAQASVPLLHRFLGIGLAIVGAVFIGLDILGQAPLLPPDEVTRVIAYALSGVGVGLIAVALLILKPRVPPRQPGQSEADYWTTPHSSGRIMHVWFVIEGAGMLSGVGFLLTGEPAAAIAMGAAIAAFWMVGPSAFAHV